MSALELYSPTDLNDALRFMEHGDRSVAVIASGTDLLPRMRKRQVAPSVLLDISSLTEDLRYIRRSDGTVRLGALTTVADLLESPMFDDRLSMVREAASLFGAPQVRNVATVGGNVCSASSSEDLIPVFLALEAEAKLVSAQGARSVPLKDFIVGKRETALRPSEILTEVSFIVPRGHNWTAYEKLGRRNMLIIAMVNEALCLILEDDLRTIRSARLALNRVSGKIPALAARTNAFLQGKKVSDGTIAEAQKVLASELSLTSDFRGSGAYRTELALTYLKRLMERCCLKAGGTS
ncbi:MAG TPA: xanthine dehydrogenase family protein subunit M [Nitrososphaerales archaeon]|nr:xanthine dehydrogenase family protein subunit M [Nitrososphaerales archaeon]